MTLDEYRVRVNRIAWERSGGAIYNGSLEHAAVVVEALLANATSEVMILTGKLNTRVYGRDDVVMQAKLFLTNSADNRLRILIEEDKPQNRELHPLLRGLSEYKGFSIRHVPEGLQASYGFHFVAADDDCYRFERDKAKPFAIAAFGDREGGVSLASFFDKAWSRCKDLPPLSLTPPAVRRV